MMSQSRDLRLVDSPIFSQIPVDWNTVPFKRLASLVTTKSNNEDLPKIGLENIRSFSSQFILANSIFEGQGIQFERGDILFGKLRPYLAKAWKAPWRGEAIGDFFVLRPNKEQASAAFLLKLILEQRFLDYLNGSTYGSKMPRVSWDTMSAIQCPLPSYEEQCQIAAYLNRETAKIDKLIAKQQKLINLSKEKLTSMVVTDLRQHDNVRLRHCVDIMHRPVALGEGNCYSKLGMFNRGRGLFMKPSTEATEMGDSDFYWVREGDLIISGQFAWEGAVGIASKEHEHCVVSHRYPVLRGRGNILLTEYLLVLFWTDFGDFLLNENSRGAAGRNRPLNLRSLLNEKIPLPPLKTQRKVCELYEWRTRFLKTVEVQKQALFEHRQALITAAVTGKIDVRGLVTHEEVAALDADPVLETTEEDFESEVAEADYITEEE